MGSSLKGCRHRSQEGSPHVVVDSVKVLEVCCCRRRLPLLGKMESTGTDTAPDLPRPFKGRDAKGETVQIRLPPNVQHKTQPWELWWCWVALGSCHLQGCFPGRAAADLATHPSPECSLL